MSTELIARLQREAAAWDTGSGDVAKLLREAADALAAPAPQPVPVLTDDMLRYAMGAMGTGAPREADRFRLFWRLASEAARTASAPQPEPVAVVRSVTGSGADAVRVTWLRGFPQIGSRLYLEPQPELTDEHIMRFMAPWHTQGDANDRADIIKSVRAMLKETPNG